MKVMVVVMVEFVHLVHPTPVVGSTPPYATTVLMMMTVQTVCLHRHRQIQTQTHVVGFGNVIHRVMK